MRADFGAETPYGRERVEAGKLWGVRVRFAVIEASPVLAIGLVTRDGAVGRHQVHCGINRQARSVLLLQADRREAALLRHRPQARIWKRALASWVYSSARSGRGGLGARVAACSGAGRQGLHARVLSIVPELHHLSHSALVHWPARILT